MRDLFKDGALKAAIVAPAPMQQNAWVLTVERTDGSHEYMTVARSTRHKIYKSLEAVSADVARVGFSEVKVVNLQVA
ncbi:plasmid replication protein RepB (plasmid) [Pseudomonas silvicola]|nr:plasmid replication protein RepB [Pseudomonas silvicola]WAH62259.1 plasmid replication protein RepB [Pseudomonas silvicola]